MNHLGEIEGASSPMAAFVDNYESRKATEQAANHAKKAAKSAEALGAYDSLPHLQAKIGPRAESNKLQDLRAYARALKQSALLVNDSSMADKITKMLAKPSSEMRELITQLVHPSDPGQPST